jgi:hypothetical protein
MLYVFRFPHVCELEVFIEHPCMLDIILSCVNFFLLWMQVVYRVILDRKGV